MSRQVVFAIEALTMHLTHGFRAIEALFRVDVILFGMSAEILWVQE